MVLTKSELVGVLRHEAHILNHLVTKVRDIDVHHKLSEKQRSVLELFQYLSFMGPVILRAIKAGGFDNDSWQSAEQEMKSLDFDQVKERLANLGDLLAGIVEEFDEEEFRQEMEMFGNRATKGVHIVNLVLQGYAAYRTQIFVQIKANGRHELNTMNLWAGMDGGM